MVFVTEIRLFGLVLFITAILLALAAVATKTSHIRFQDPFQSGSSSGTEGPETQDVAFTKLPIIWPLIAIAATGLLFWLSFSTEPPRKPPKRYRRTRR